jgi:predicted outer membrane repeat protein
LIGRYLYVELRPALVATAEWTVSLSSAGTLFTIEDGVTLTLDNNVTLQSRDGSNTAPLVQVNSGGTLMMKTGSKITGNNSGVSGGGVYVGDGGTFTMSGGTISENTATGNGGGVYVNGTFTKESGGVIYGSDADSDLKNTAGNGPAVYTYSGKKRNTTADAGVTLNSGTDANWEYTVTFDVDGGTPMPDPMVVYGGASLGTMPTEPSKTDCTFLGWYTARNGGGTAVTATTTVSADITVYAWLTRMLTMSASTGLRPTRRQTGTIPLL